jgi:glycosyltransferase involved in cell wall biosynthesis
MISIIIPVYNQAEHLDNCLASIKKQTHDNYEIIIIDDGSTDDIGEVIKKYKRIFRLNLSYFDQENRGASVARNRGAKIAKGEYLIFCDADVIMEPEMLELMLTALKNNPQAGFCYSSFLWGNRKFILWPYSEIKLKQMPYINTCSLIRREYFPGFDENLKRFQDWDLWLALAESGRSGVWVDKILYQVNTAGAQTMSRWLPSLAYKLLPFLPSVRKYNLAKEIIKKKHNL